MAGCSRTTRLVLTASILLGAGRAPLATAATHDVDALDDAADATPGDGACATAAGTCTLRAAVMETNAVSGPHVVNVPAGTYLLGGALAIGRETTLEGAGADVVTVDAGGVDRAFVEQAPAGTVTIRGMTIRNGRGGAGSYGGLIRTTGIRVVIEDCVLENGDATTTGGGGALGLQADSNIVRRCTLRGNTAGSGGAVFVTSSALLEDCVIEANSAQWGGGAGTYTQLSSITLRRCEFRDNVAVRGGGGFRNEANATLESCTFTGNQALEGGGVQHDCRFTNLQTRLTNCTLHGNSASTGGGLAKTNVGTVTMNHCTIASNTASSRSGGYSGDAGVTIRNTIVFGNAAPTYPDCGNPAASLPQSGGYNLVGDATCVLGGTTGTNIRGRDPLLNAPADNGGSVRTQSMPSTSPAVDAIPPPTVATDARDEARPADGNGDGTSRNDVGAFELVPFAASGLAVNRAILLTATGPQPAVATIFDPACRQPAWLLCPEEVVDAPLAGLVLSGEATATRGDGTLWLYEHSDATQSMSVTKQVLDLAFAP